MYRRCALLVAVLSAALLTGCSEDSESDPTSAAGSATPPNPSSTSTGTSPASSAASAPAETDTACGLLSTDEVAEAVGDAVKAGTATGGPVATSDRAGCTYYSAADPTDKANVFIYSTTEPAERAFAAGGTALSGIGDRAVVTGSAAATTVWFTVGDRSGSAGWASYSTSAQDGIAKGQALAEALAAAIGDVPE